MAENLTHMMSLSIGVATEEQFDRAIEIIDDAYGIARVGRFPYVSQYSSVVDDENEQQPGEDLFYDAGTMEKVHKALRQAVKDMEYSTNSVDEFVFNLINSMQNAGILFRERR